MIKNAKPGQRVKLSDATIFSSSIQKTHNGDVVAKWFVSDGKTGTVKRVLLFGVGRSRRLIVVPDAPNFGEFWLRPKDVDKLESKNDNPNL